MWIIIILVVIGVLGIGLTIFIATTYYEEYAIITGVFGGVALVGAIVCSIICGVINSQSHILSTEYKLAEQIKLFENDKAILESYHLITEGNKTTFTSDMTFEVVSTAEYYRKVSDYNQSVYEFKVEVKTKQNQRNNVWISWFVCPAYLSISDETLNNLTYTIGK